MASSFTMQRVVQFHETDLAQQVHFSKYFLYMEEAEHAFFRSLGLSIALKAEGKEISWPRVSCSFDYKKPLRFEDEFEAKLVVEKMGTSSITYRVTLVRDKEVMAEGRSTSVCCVIGEETLQSIPIPEIFRDKIELQGS